MNLRLTSSYHIDISLAAFNGDKRHGISRGDKFHGSNDFFTWVFGLLVNLGFDGWLQVNIHFIVNRLRIICSVYMSVNIFCLIILIQLVSCGVCITVELSAFFS